MLCRDVMLTYVYPCAQDESVEDAARVMRDERLGVMPVVDERGRVVGVLTDRDIAVRAIAEGLPGTTPVTEIMTGPPLLATREDDDVLHAEELMTRECKSRMLVLDDDGRCVGIISLSDIAQAPPDQSRPQGAGHSAIREGPDREHGSYLNG